MKRLLFCLTIACCFFAAVVAAADEEVFSGPQVGEKLVPFTVRGVLGDLAGKEIDLIGDAGGKPVAVIFVHELTRPSVALTRLVMNYAALRGEDGLTGGVVFLSGDVTDAEQRIKRAAHALPQDVPIGISLDGREGPGAYGLNRNVTLTVLVGKENKVTANFALVQPSVQADVPKIVKAMVEVLGGGEVPTLAQLGAGRYAPPDQRKKRNPRGAELPPELASRVRAIIQKTATPEEVDQRAAKIEQYLAENPRWKARVGTIARNIIDAGKLQDYGTPAAQKYLTKWAQEYAPRDAPKKQPQRPRDPESAPPEKER